MIRGVRAGLTLAISALLVAPAAAVPAVDQVIGATGEFNLAGRDLATYNVHVVARLSRVGTRLGQGTVTVSISRCASFRCAKAVTYVGAITDQQLTVAPDLTGAHLQVPLFGRPLVLTWDEPSSVPLPAYGRDEVSGTTWVRSYRITHAIGFIAGRPCETDQSTVLTEHLAEVSPASPPKALPKKAPRPFAGLLTSTCAYSKEVD